LTYLVLAVGINGCTSSPLSTNLVKGATDHQVQNIAKSITYRTQISNLVNSVQPQNSKSIDFEALEAV
jgi:hypothetical protein